MKMNTIITKINSKHGLSLMEITLACIILVMALIPLMTNQSSSAKKVIETEKIQMSERILESIKEEMMTTKYSKFNELSKSQGLEKSTAAHPLTDAYYPMTNQEVLIAQQKFKDFEVIGTWSYAIDKDGQLNTQIMNVEVECSFIRDDKSKKSVNKNFLVIDLL
ncbi:MAG: hypothetical protein GX221_04785 [Candidatus Riflebacteria bacterium]|nr:hypothetical protein [Candidatus Riflebacteria bacterium]